MKKNKHLKAISILWILALSVVSVEAVVLEVKMRQFPEKPSNSLILTPQLPALRAKIPSSLEGRIRTTEINFQKETNSSSNCDTNTSLCASFELNTTQEDVSAWMGFEFKENKETYFVATHGQKAKDLGNGLYSTEKWDKRHLWLKIGENSTPLAIQTRYLGIDDESSNEWYVVDYLGFRKANAGIDYSKYLDNMSTSALILLVNPKTKEVLEYYIEYYDENNEYLNNYEIEVGDEIESYFIGFKKDEGDFVYLFSVEDINTITHPLTFSYKKQYPGKDFNCTNCGELDLSQTEFKYIFESYGKIRSNFTEPLPVEKSTNTVNASTSKSVPFSGAWILFFLVAFIGIINLKNKNLD